MSVTRKGSALRLCRQTIASLTPYRTPEPWLRKPKVRETLGAWAAVWQFRSMYFLTGQELSNVQDRRDIHLGNTKCAFAQRVGRYGSVTCRIVPKFPHRAPPQLEQGGM